MLSDSEPFEKCRTKKEAIRCYTKRLEEIKKIALKEYAIESREFAELFKKEFLDERFCTTPKPASKSTPISKSHFSQITLHYIVASMKYVRRYAFYIVVAAIVFILVNYRVELTRIFMRNIQVYIYPGMRLWRKLTLPIIQRFPHLTKYYDETCLVKNPFFRVANLDCSPCADVINVVDLTKVPPLGYLGTNIPHIIQQAGGVNQSIARIHQIYQENRQMFRNEAYEVRSTDANIQNLDQLFDMLVNEKENSDTVSHNLWRINRMTPARMLRAAFPAPKSIPKNAGIDIERHIAFDVNGGVTYQLPSTDCSNMFIHQAVGSRIIHLQPTIECKGQCRRLTVKLKPNHTLFYDWWYYKPISSPVQQLTKITSVSYIGAYCI